MPKSRVHTQTFPHINDSIIGLAGKCPFRKWFQGFIILFSSVSVQNLNLWTFFWAQHAHSPHNRLYFGQVIHLGCKNIECDHCTVFLCGEQIWKAILSNMSQYSFMVGLSELHPFLIKKLWVQQISFSLTKLHFSGKFLTDFDLSFSDKFIWRTNFYAAGVHSIYN